MNAPRCNVALPGKGRSFVAGGWSISQLHKIVITKHLATPEGVNFASLDHQLTTFAEIRR